MAIALRLSLLAFWLTTISGVNAKDLPAIDIPNKLSGSNVLILVKQDDPLSQKIADYYAQQRYVPTTQIASVSLPPHANRLSPQQFSMIMQQLSPNSLLISKSSYSLLMHPIVLDACPLPVLSP